jgi:hypothetical protein
MSICYCPQSVMSALRRKATLLSPNRRSELVWDSESDEAGAPSSSTSEDEGGFEDEPVVSHVQPDLPSSSGQVSSSSLSSASDKEEDVQSGPGQQIQTLSPSQCTRPSGPHRGVVHTFTGSSSGKRDCEAPHINDGYSPLNVFWSYFAEIIKLLVVETKRYCHDHLDRLDEGISSPT